VTNHGEKDFDFKGLIPARGRLVSRI